MTSRLNLHYSFPYAD